MFLFVTLSLCGIAALFAWATSYSVPVETRDVQQENGQKISRDSVHMEFIPLNN